MKSLTTYKYHIIVFIILGFLVYSPKLFNGFVWDDIVAFLQNPRLHHFNFSVFFDNVYNTDQEYRQFMPFFWSLYYTLFGPNAFPYHLTQLILHILCTILLFFLYKKYFTHSLAFILSTLFLIHPINAEAVLWLSTIQTQAYIALGLSALLLLHKKMLKTYHLVITGVLLFLSLLSYEAGIFFTPLAILYIYLYRKTHLKNILFIVLVIALFYIYLRVLGGLFNFTFFQDDLFYPATLAQRLYTMPAIIFFYFGTFLFPKTLMIWQSWRINEFSFSQVLLPALVIQIVLLFYFRFVSKVKKQKASIYFFTFWFLIGLGSLLQIYPLDMTVSERWFYFPIIGLLGILGHIYNFYKMPLQRYQKILIILLIILFSVYSIRTFVRAFDWRDNTTLFNQDIKKQPDNYKILYELGGKYFNEKKYTEAIPYIEKVAENYPRYSNTLIELGIMYEALGEYDKAIYYYKRIQNEITNPLYHKVFDSNLAIAKVYMKAKRYKELENFLSTDFIEKSDNKKGLLFLRAKAYYAEKNYNAALADAEYLTNNYNDEEFMKFYNDIKTVLDNTSN